MMKQQNKSNLSIGSMGLQSDETPYESDDFESQTSSLMKTGNIKL